MKTAKELLNYINPAELDYQDWVNVGMALKHEGYTAADWDSWSQNDNRYKRGECFKKWASFQRDDGVTGGTIYELARRGGYEPEKDLGSEIGWNDSISDDGKIIDTGWLESGELEEPSDSNWNPVRELITYLQTLFQSTECVGYVTEVYENENRLSPKKGSYDRTAGQLIELLEKCKGDLGAVIGDVNPKAGAWIRFNPLDGNGVKNDNVTDFRFSLVESDTLELGKQRAIIEQLELPVAAMVYSGGKSVHAIVRIEASDYTEYRKRVEYLYSVCEKNGLKIDTQNKNPSRLSRMPGIIRNGHKQFLIATNIGKASWAEWEEWIDGINDDLPDPEALDSVWNNLPPLAECLIEGVLRKGHKMLLSGPSKAGKSFALIELTIAIAEGKKWVGFQCSQGRVMYVNLELDRASCLHRFKDVYAALGWQPDHIGNIDIWNLRGKAVPMDKLAPKLIRRAEKKNYTAVIIDPIYKVITGDENSASEMANFCNQFDKVCSSLKCAVIYCHHHSKGNQGNKKAMDRSSGSGVFARDPDTMLDLTELELTDAIRAAQNGKARISGIERALTEFSPGWEADVGQDERLSPSQMTEFASGRLKPNQLDKMTAYILEALKTASWKTAWRIECTLREFPQFQPLNLWFDYPVHHVDDTGALADIKIDDTPSWMRAMKSRKSKSQNKETRRESVDTAFDMCSGDGEVTVQDMAEYLGMTEKTVRRHLKESGNYEISDNKVTKTDEKSSGTKT